MALTRGKRTIHMVMRYADDADRENDALLTDRPTKRADAPRRQHVRDLATAARNRAGLAAHYLIEYGTEKEVRLSLAAVVDDPGATKLLCKTAENLDMLPSLVMPLRRAACRHATKSLDLLIERCRDVCEIRHALAGLVDRDRGEAVKALLSADALRHRLGDFLHRDWIRKALHRAAVDDRPAVVARIVGLCQPDSLVDVLLVCGGEESDGRAFERIWPYAVDVCSRNLCDRLGDTCASRFLQSEMKRLRRHCLSDGCLCDGDKTGEEVQGSEGGADTADDGSMSPVLGGPPVSCV